MKIFRVLLCTLLLAACTYNPFVANNHNTGSLAGTTAGVAAGAGTVALLGGSKPLMVVAGVGGGMLGYYLTTLRHDAGAIIQAKGQVYQLGEFTGIYIPSDVLFEPNTDEFRPQANLILDSVATVLDRSPRNNIIISGNTSGFYRAKWEQHLSEKRAQKIAAYLWNTGIINFQPQSNDTRRLRYVGYGDYYPISNTYTNAGIRTNSRVQIVSYPDACHLHLDKRSAAVYNIGDLNSDAMINRASSARCCPSEESC